MIDPLTTLAFWTPGPLELIIIGILGVLIFGKRLPEVGKSVGKGIVEFKKGLSGVEDQLNDADQTKANANADQDQPNRLAQSSQPSAPQTNAQTQPPTESEPRSPHPSP